jgi:putative endonuclease
MGLFAHALRPSAEQLCPESRTLSGFALRATNGAAILNWAKNALRSLGEAWAYKRIICAQAPSNFVPSQDPVWIRPSGYEWRSHSKLGAERTSFFSAIIAFVHYVYLIRSVNQPHKSYVGYTEDLRLRMTAHNNGSSTHTSQYCPWVLITYLGFSDKYRALDFERYLKSSSGKAFAKKRLWSAQP